MAGAGILLSFVFLLLGVLRYNKLWLGAIGGMVTIFVFNLLSTEELVVLAPLLNGTVISIELLMLIFGAYLFYKTLNTRNHFLHFFDKLQHIPDRFDLILLFALFFGSFLEGIAGFGIPAMLIAPLLLSLGFKPLTCIVIPLVANTIPVLFGALGTPILVGLGTYLLPETIEYVLIINVMPILLIPFVIAYLYQKTECTTLFWSKLWKKLLVCGLVYALVFVLAGLISIEFPSVLAGFIAMLVFNFIYIPSDVRPKVMVWITTFWPYVLFILLFMASRIILREHAILVLDSGKVLSAHQPGLIFVLAAFIFNRFSNQPFIEDLREWSASVKSLTKTGVSIFTLVLFTQFVQVDLSNLAFDLIAHTNARVSAPFFGVFGSFISGSATMSNLLFTSVFSDSALFMALLHTGSAMGNAISLQNILIVNAVVGRDIKIVEVIRKTVLWVLVYMLSVLLVNFVWLVL